MTLAVGSRLGPYEVLGLVGAGGMGEVYRALDPRLGREVAVKVLPSSVSQDADRLRRFEQEARAASALNHPNILAIYDIGSHDGAPYVVSELLEGETLRERLSGSALTARKAVDYGIQIVEGLAAAHEKEIVHRDLKPENLFVTKDGRIKILDFGLAKLTRSEGPSGPQTETPTVPAGTEPGVILGTVGYMSPEQVRGRAADHRSDIFSFGAILYEMLSGRRAFLGDSAADTMSAILMKEPEDLSATNRNIPPGLERIVRHCLEKSPEERFHSAHDLAFQFEAFSDASSPLQAAAPQGMARVGRMPWLAVALLLALAGLAYLLLRRPPPSEPPRTSFLTFSGHDADPAASPDGRLVAFVSQRDGRSRIWLKQIATGDEVSLTSGKDTAPRFSPDGSEVLFARAEGSTSSLFRVSLVGGEPRKMIENALSGDWSPDGSRISSTRSGNIDVWQVHRKTGSVRRLTSDPADDWDPGFTPDGKNLLFSSNRGGHFEIWVADADGRRARQLTNDGVDAENATATPEGEWIVYASGHPQKRGLWKIRNDGSGAIHMIATPVLHPEVSPDGSYVMYHTPSDPGWSEIRVIRTEDGAPVDFRIRVDSPGGQAAQDLIFWPGSLGRARWMPDGRAIAYVAVDEKGQTGVMVQDFVPGRDTSASRRPLVGFDGKIRVESLGISPDGSRLSISGVEASPGLMIAQGLPGVEPARTKERQKR